MGERRGDEHTHREESDPDLRRRRMGLGADTLGGLFKRMGLGTVVALGGLAVGMTLADPYTPWGAKRRVDSVMEEAGRNRSAIEEMRGAQWETVRRLDRIEDNMVGVKEHLEEIKRELRRARQQ